MVKKKSIRRYGVWESKILRPLYKLTVIGGQIKGKNDGSVKEAPAFC